MTRVGTVVGRSFWGPRLVAAALAVVGQLGFASAALTLARDESSAVSHVEQKGVDLHHGHNEATCPACIALSTHATVNPGGVPIVPAPLARVAPAPRLASFAAPEQVLPNSCRA